jgi:tetratricopeptide (TPR) repeat protein/S1-C subfamily serine protease
MMHRNSLFLIASLGLLLIPATLSLGGCSSETPNGATQLTQKATTQPATNPTLSPEQLQQVASSITVKVFSGDNRGSGTLIGKQGEGENQVYTVLTNDHVLGDETTSEVKTPDGQVYPAVVKPPSAHSSQGGEDIAGKDMVLLEFRSSRDYQVATQTGNSPTVDDPVLAAGFPFEANDLVFTTGTVEFFLNRALKNGYQVGYSNQIQQGMSGGPVLNGQGELVAINGLAAYPVLQQAYVYQDGSVPDDDLRQQMNRVSWGIPVAMLIPGEIPPNPPLKRGGYESTPPLAKEGDNNSPPLPRGAGGDSSAKGNEPNSPPLPRGAGGDSSAKGDEPNSPPLPRGAGGDSSAKEGDNNSPPLPRGAGGDSSAKGDESNSPPLAKEGDESNSPPFSRGAGGDRRPLTGLAAEVDKVAAKITVRIEDNKSNGSGVIVAQNGNIYYVATATHVVKYQAQYHVVTPDGNRYPVDYGKVTLFPGVDLAVLQFSSPETYPVATLAKYKLKYDEGQWVFLSGWPGVQPGNPFQREFTAGLAFSEFIGSVSVKDASSLVNGYELVYTNLSKGGMSGGPVLDTQGRVIGIHAAAEGDNLYPVQLGYSLGVPIRTLVGLASQAGIQPEWLKVETSRPKELTEEESDSSIKAWELTLHKPSSTGSYEDWVNYGNQFWRFHLNKKALDAFDQAIKLKPNRYHAWYGRGLALKQDDKYREAIAAFEEVTEINSRISPAWRERGELFAKLKDYPQALESIDEAIKHSRQPDFKLYALRGDWLLQLKRYSEAVDAYSKAINIKPYPFIYKNRGVARSLLKDYEKAIEDFTHVINLDPEDAGVYVLRGTARSKRKEYEKAIADYDQAINLDPEYASAYYNRGNARSKRKEYEKAIEDYTQAINLDPEDVAAYAGRGLAWDELGQYQQVIEDFTEVINLDPEFAAAYNTRGFAYFKQGDKEKAIEDMEKGTELFCQQGHPECEQLRDFLKLLGG